MIGVCLLNAMAAPALTEKALAEFLELTRIPKKLIDVEKPNLAVWGTVDGIFLAKLELTKTQYFALLHDRFFNVWNESELPGELWGGSWGLANDLPKEFLPSYPRGKTKWLSFSRVDTTRLYVLETRGEPDTMTACLYFFYSQI